MIEDNITDAIVPIYCDNVFRGTGFIYKSYLITVEHVVRLYEDVYVIRNKRYVKEARVLQEYEMIEYEYKGKRYLFKYEDAIWSKKQYGDGSVFDFIDEDLAIFKLQKENDCLSMYESDDMEDLCAVLHGFHYYNEENISLKNRELKLSNMYICMGVHHITQKKCCYGTIIHEGDDIIEGYSGGPVLCNNKIAGMLIGKLPDSDSCHLMKSSHILRMILEHEHNTKMN